MKLQDAIDEFLADRESFCEAATIKYYTMMFNIFNTFIQDKSVVELEQLDKQLIKDYIFYLRSLKIKNTTIHSYMRAIKSFVNYLLDNEYIEKNILRGVKLPRPDPELVEPLTSKEVQQIDAAIIDYNAALSLRNFCIFRLALDCGLRKQEILNLKINDIKPDKILIRNSKYNKSRIVYLPEFLLHNLQNYIQESGRALSSVDYVFLDYKNQDHISDNSIKMFFQDLKTYSGVPRIHAHLCRHTFATSYLQYGGDIEKLRLLMGHSDYSVLQKYLHLSLLENDIYKLDDIFFKNRKLDT